MVHNVGGGVKVGRGPVWAKQGQKNVGTRVVRELNQNNCLLLHALFNTSKLVHG
jgi:hypothetical protein